MLSPNAETHTIMSFIYIHVFYKIYLECMDILKPDETDIIIGSVSWVSLAVSCWLFSSHHLKHTEAQRCHKKLLFQLTKVRYEVTAMK